MIVRRRRVWESLKSTVAHQRSVSALQLPSRLEMEQSLGPSSNRFYLLLLMEYLVGQGLFLFVQNLPTHIHLSISLPAIIFSIILSLQSLIDIPIHPVAYLYPFAHSSMHPCLPPLSFPPSIHPSTLLYALVVNENLCNNAEKINPLSGDTTF